MPDPWTITEHAFDPATARAYEGLFTLGSGYLHVRGSLEEHFADEPQNAEYTRLPANVTSETFRAGKAKWGTYVPGVFARHPLLNNQMVNLPWFLGLAPVIDGERLDLGAARPLEYRRELSLRDATLRRTVRWKAWSGTEAAAVFERFVSAARPHLCAQRLTVTCDRPAEVRALAGIDSDVRTNGHNHFARAEVFVEAGDHVACTVRTDAPAGAGLAGPGGDRVRVTSTLTCASDRCLMTHVEPEAHAPGKKHDLVATVQAPAGVPVVFEKRSAVATSRDPKGEFEPHLEAARPMTYEALHAEHAAEWASRWEECDVRIEGGGGVGGGGGDGDDAARSQLALRLGLFHLLRAHVPGDPRVAIDAKGYAGEAYWGRYFWDTEMYLLPFFLYTNPRKARTLADFRVRSLPGARRNAARYGYPGARYAWESDAAGDECCPNWQYADHEVHVTADVVHGLAHYAAAMGEDAGAAYLLASDESGDAAAPTPASVAVETARYWMERLTHHPDGAVALLGVMGPDEYKPITNNNAYTNRLVAFALETAAGIAEAAELPSVSAEERAAWLRAAKALPLPVSADGLLLQCDAFDAFADPGFDRLWKDRSKTFGATVSQERLYRSKALKQADALMLIALFPEEFTREEAEKAWNYYLPYTTHDSSLSPGAHCLLACRLGKRAEAWDFWRRGSAIDLPVADGGDGGAAEGIHIAGAAALWQMAVLGFAGLRTALQSDTLTLNPTLPDAWTSLTFPLVWKGQRVLVEIDRATVTIHNRSDVPLAARVRCDHKTIAPGHTIAFGLA